MKKRVLIDFDGVIHSYRSGWVDRFTIPDPPIPLAIYWLNELIEDPEWEPVIFTSRASTRYETDLRANNAIRDYLVLHGLNRQKAQSLVITGEKLPAVLMIDDRAFKFEGTFPSLHYLNNFQPWRLGDSNETSHD